MTYKPSKECLKFNALPDKEKILELERIKRSYPDDSNQINKINIQIENIKNDTKNISNDADNS